MANLRLIHLSDIHFAGPHWQANLRFDQKMVLRAIHRDILALREQIGSPDIICVTGDIAFSADEAQEYAEARKWFSELLDELDMRPSRLLLVPGNHDVNRTASRGSRSRERQFQALRKNPEFLDDELADEESCRQLWAKFAGFEKFARLFDDGRWSAKDPFAVWDDVVGDASVGAVGLNTALLSYDSEDSNNNLILGNRQLNAVHGRPQDRLLLVLAHHPPSWLRDGRKLTDILPQWPSILLCGHLHDPGAFLQEPLEGKPWLSLHAGAGYGEQEGQHSYAWAEVSPRGFAYYPRSYGRGHRFEGVIPRSRYRKPIKSKVPDLGDYLLYPLAKLPPLLRGWIERPPPAPQAELKGTPRERLQDLEEHLFGEPLSTELDERRRQARALREQGRPEDAIQIYEQIITELDRRLSLADTDEIRRQLRQQRTRFLLGQAQCHGEAGRPEQAKAVYLSVLEDFDSNANNVRPRSRISLAEGLALFRALDEARRVLPLETEWAALPEEDLANARYVRDLIDIYAGVIPDPLPESPILQMHAAQVLLRQGDAERAVHVAAQISLQEEGASSPLRSGVLGCLLDALIATVWEMPMVRRGVPLLQRKALLRIIEREMPREPPEPLREQYAVLHLKKDLYIKDAPPGTWHHRIQEIWRMPIGPERIVAMEQLAQEFPHRMLIEYELAEHLLHEKRSADALAHARTAFILLPGRKQRLRLASVLFDCYACRRARILLSPLSDDEPDVRKLRALATSYDPRSMEESVPLLRRCLEDNDKATDIWLALAQVQARLGLEEEAAIAAWKAYQNGGVTLPSEAIFLIAELQPLSGSQRERSMERIEQVVRVLSERSEGEPAAIKFRFQLLLRLGFPREHPIDWDKMKQEGVLWPISPEEGLALIKEGVQETVALQWLYQDGYLPLEALCQLTETPVAAFLNRVLAQPRSPGTLCVAWSTKTRPALRGVHLLCSALELLLLQHLGKLERLRCELGPDGKILLFNDVVEQAQEEGLSEGFRDHTERDRAIALQRTIAEGLEGHWLQRIPRPQPLDTLPPARPGTKAEQMEVCVRRPTDRALDYHRALEGHSERMLLAADFYTADPLAATHWLVRVLHFKTPEQWKRLRALVHAERVLGLPALFPDDQLYQERTAGLGFLDSSFTKLLLRKEPRLEATALDQLEYRARRRDHVAHHFSRIYLSRLYGSACWLALCDAHAERPELVPLLLQRCEALDDGFAPRMLDAALDCIADLTERFLEPAIEMEGDSLTIPGESAAIRLWTQIAAWAGSTPNRRSAIGYALSSAWLRLDRRQSEASDVSTLVLLMVLQSSRPDPSRVNLLWPDIRALATVSYAWPTPPLGQWSSPEDSRSVEDVLTAAARQMEHSRLTQEPGPWDSERYLYRDGHQLRALPVEAVLLRANAETIAWAAGSLSAHQGMHDHRVYQALRQLSERPDDQDLRRRYARLMVNVPWRLVREDPTRLLTWSQQHWLPGYFPNTLADLRQILGEEPLDDQAELILPSLQARRWRDLPHGFALYQHALQIPGFLAMSAAAQRIDPNLYEEFVHRAVAALEHPETLAVGELCCEVIFLRYALTHQPVVGGLDLRERAPALLEAVLDAVLKEPTPDTLAAAEDALLRTCSAVISGLSGPEPLPMREGLWLCHRLYQWFIAQLRAGPDPVRAYRAVVAQAPASSSEPLRDLLHPMNFGRGRIDHRLIAVLYALALGEQLSILKAPPSSVEGMLDQPIPAEITSSGLEGLLAQVAARPLSVEEQALRPLQLSPTRLDWKLPGSAPDLALTALLLLTRGKGWLLLEVETRLSWLRQLPIDPEGQSAVEPKLASWIVGATAEYCHHVTEKERNTLLDLLRRMPDGEQSRKWRLDLYSALYRMGRTELGSELEALLQDAKDADQRPLFVGRYLTGLSHLDPGRALTEARRWLGHASEKEAPVLLGSLGHVLLHGNPAVKPDIEALLVELAQVPPFRDDSSSRRLLHLLGLSDRIAL